MAKIHNKDDWQFNPFLGSTFLAILVFAKHFWSFVILRMFWWQYGQWHHLSQTPLVSYSPTSRLDSWNSWNCSIEMAEEATMIFTSRLNYTTVVAWNLSKSGQQVWNLIDAGRQTWVVEECQSWQRHLSSWCYGKTWLGKITKVSQLRVIFWFNSLYNSGIHGRAFNLSHLDS
jgi:hypothetical protein